MNYQRTSNSWHYDSISKCLHWILAILIIGLIGLGWYMMYIEDQPRSGWYFDLHKSLGLTVAGLVLFRILWRFKHKPADLPLGIPRWQAKTSKTIHLFLYVFMLAMPITGYIGAANSQYPLAFFGLPLTEWAHKSHVLSKNSFALHSKVVWILVVLIALHFLAALKHLVINKDGVFQRMWFNFKTASFVCPAKNKEDIS